MSDWWPFIIARLTSGSLYALAGLGLVLTFKTSGIVNFAYGAFAAVAAFALADLWQTHGISWPIAGLIVLLVLGVGGGLLFELLTERLATRPYAARLAATTGLMVALQGAVLAVYGTEQKFMPSFLPTNFVRVAGVNIRMENVCIVFLSLASAFILSWWLGRTRSGVAIIAAVENPVLLSFSGTSPRTVRRRAWVVGSSFAAASGMLLAPISGLNVGVLTLLIYFAFGAGAVGAFNSLWLTYAGGLAIGVAASVLTKALSYTDNRTILNLPPTLPFLVLLIGLLVTPRRMFAHSAAEPAPSSWRLAPRVLVITGAGILLVVPHLVGARITIYITAMSYAIVFLSLNVLVRLSGQLSLCQMSFAAVGGVAFAKAAVNGVPWPLAVLFGGVVAALIGAVAAIPSMRLSGNYLAIATFGFGLLVQNLFYPSVLMFGYNRPVDAPRPNFSESDTGYYYVVLIVAVLCALLVLSLAKSRLGRLLRGLGEAPLAVDSLGADTNYTRVLAFGLAAFLAGIGGAVLGPVTGTISAPLYDFSISLVLVAVAVMAGDFLILAAFAGSALFILIPGYITSTELTKWLPVIFGSGAVIASVAGGTSVAEKFPITKRFRERAVRSPVRSRFVRVSSEGETGGIGSGPPLRKQPDGRARRGVQCSDESPVVKT